MPNFGMLPQTAVLLAQATQTTNTTSATVKLPGASSYRLILQVQTVSGTSPTMQVNVATSCDNGTTFNEVLQFTQVTTSGQGRQMLIRPYLGIGDAATEQVCSLLGTADLASAQVVNNGPLNPAYIQVRSIFGGTTPSFAWALHYIALPQDLAD